MPISTFARPRLKYIFRRHQREVFFQGLRRELADLAPVEEQLARPLGDVVELVGVAVLLDIAAHQPDFVAFDAAVRLLHRHVAVAEALHFAAGQDDAALQRVEHEIIVARTGDCGR